jgi:hypothetical protein
LPRLKKIALLLCGLLLLGSQMAGSSLGAGTIDWWVAAYERGERHKALFHLMDCADNYQAPGDDLLLLPVIQDALGREAKVAELAVQVFLYYNQLYGARKSASYATLQASLAQRGVKVDLRRYEKWMVVIAERGANLRQSPSSQGKVLTALKTGMQALPLGESGSWVEVKPVGPGAVDPRFERVRGYVHASLLAPY